MKRSQSEATLCPRSTSLSPSPTWSHHRRGPGIRPGPAPVPWVLWARRAPGSVAVLGVSTSSSAGRAPAWPYYRSGHHDEVFERITTRRCAATSTSCSSSRASRWISRDARGRGREPRAAVWPAWAWAGKALCAVLVVHGLPGLRPTAKVIGAFTLHDRRNHDPHHLLAGHRTQGSPSSTPPPPRSPRRAQPVLCQLLRCASPGRHRDGICPRSVLRIGEARRAGRIGGVPSSPFVIGADALCLHLNVDRV